MRILIDTHANLYRLSGFSVGVVDRIKNRRRIYAPVDFTFQAELWDLQVLEMVARARFRNWFLGEKWGRFTP